MTSIILSRDTEEGPPDTCALSRPFFRAVLNKAKSCGWRPSVWPQPGDTVSGGDATAMAATLSQCPPSFGSRPPVVPFADHVRQFVEGGEFTIEEEL